MNSERRSAVDAFLDEIGRAPVPAGLAHNAMARVRADRTRRGRPRPPIALAAALGIAVLAIGVFIVGSAPTVTPSPSPSLPTPTPSPSAIESLRPTPTPPITGSWQLTLPLFQERSFRLEVADQSGSLIDARVAAEWPAGLETLEDPFDLYIAPLDGKPTEVFVGWSVLVCEYRGRLLLDQTASSIVLELAPSPGCELAPISQGVILEFAVDVDATALTGRQSRDPLVELEGFLPSAIAFADRNVGWIGGTNAKSDALILHTVDGGATWTTAGLGPGSVREIATIDARNAYSTLVCVDHEVECRSGTFSWDDDFAGWGGKAFERFVAIDFARDHGIAVVLPHADGLDLVPSLLLNEDGGNTDWPGIDDPCTAGTILADAERTSDLDLFVLCLGEGGAGGTFKALLTSADRGATWAERASTEGSGLFMTGTPYGFDMVGDGSGWMWGSRMPLLHTPDAGATWADLNVADGDVRIVNDASYLGGGAGFVLVHDPDRQAILLLWTRDGQTWEELRSWPLP